MNPNETQPNNPQMSADQSSAALAFATQLQEQMMPQAEEQPIEGTEMAENAPEQEEIVETQNEVSKEDEGLKNEISEIRTDIQLIKKLLLKDERVDKSGK